MSWKENKAKSELIEKSGQTAGLPLFQQGPEKRSCQMPDWIFDGSEIKAMVYRAMEERFQPNENKVLTAMITLKMGSDHDIKDFLGWQINQVTGRRKHLEELGIIEFAFKRKIGPFGSPNCVWKLNFLKLKEALDL